MVGKLGGGAGQRSDGECGLVGNIVLGVNRLGRKDWFRPSAVLATTWAACLVIALVPGSGTTVATSTIIAIGVGVFIILTIFLTRGDIVTPTRGVDRLGWRTTVVGVFVIFTAIVPFNGSFAALWSDMVTVPLSRLLQLDRSTYVYVPLFYFVGPFLALRLMGVRGPELGLTIGRRNIPVLLLWCGPIVLWWIYRLASGGLGPVNLGRTLGAHILLSGPFEEFLFRGALSPVTDR